MASSLLLGVISPGLNSVGMFLACLARLYLSHTHRDRLLRRQGHERRSATVPVGTRPALRASTTRRRELGRLDDVVNYATGKGLKIEIEPHNYGYGFGALIGSAQTPNSSFADLWANSRFISKPTPMSCLG